MTQADIVCACGHRFTVDDSGHGAPHACPQCRLQNVLPRSGRSSAAASDGAATAVRSTRVLSNVALHRSAAEGLPPGTQLGAYRLVRRIGKGGMGSVYEAVDDANARRVALKVLSPELASRPDFVARFQREAKALANLSDPRIARVHFSGAAEGLPFFTMDLIDGHDLEQVLQREGPLAPDRAIHLMREVALGLEAANERGIVHRDVKPTNVLLASDGTIRIVDFGLSKALDSDTRLTVTGAVVGTPFYVSPEQGLGKKNVDQRADIYSLGACFYHLLSGKPVFDAESPVSIILRHVNDPPESLRKRNPKVPDPLARIVMRCLAKDPARRYQDYQELIADLDAAARGEPVAAPSEDSSSRAPSFVVMDDYRAGARVLKHAGRLRRVLAFGLDTAVLLPVWWIAAHFRELPLLPLMIPFSVGYFAVGDATGGQSLGKRFFRLRVANPDGGEPGLLRAAARALCSVPLVLAGGYVQGSSQRVAESFSLLLHACRLDAVPVDFQTVLRIAGVLVLLDAVATFLSPKRLALHDLLSGTAVFREDVVKRRKKSRSAGDERPVAPIWPLVASVLPGFGQLVNGEMGKGLLFFIGIVVGLPAGALPGLAIWALAAWEAHRTATLRRREFDLTRT